MLAGGGERLTLTLYADDAALWRKLLSRYGSARGAKMQAFRDAVTFALEHGHIELSDEALVAELRQRLGLSGAPKRRTR